MNGLKRNNSELEFNDVPNHQRRKQGEHNSEKADDEDEVMSNIASDYNDPSITTGLIASTSTSLPSNPTPTPDMYTAPELSNKQVVERLNKWTETLTSLRSLSASSSSSSTSLINGRGKEKETPESLEKESLLAGGGSITLTSKQTSELISTLQSTVQAFLSTPITKSDLAALFNHLVEGSSTILNSSSPLYNAARNSTKPKKLSPFQRLPEDIIVLIMKSLREIHENQPEDGGVTGFHSNTRTSWMEMKRLSVVSRSWRSALRPLYLAECHLNDIRMFPILAKRLRGDLVRAQGLTSLFIKVYDFEFSFAKSSLDAGFSLPDCIRLAPNLLNFSIQSDRNTAAASFRRNLRETHDITAFTGGVSLPDTIIASCKSLRSLKFGVSCTVDDISNFTAHLRELRSLIVTGEIDSTSYTIPFKTCGPRLKKLWLPTTSLGPFTLANLVLNSNVVSLATMIDIDDHFNPSPPTAEAIALTKAKLVKLFERIGGNLLELSISTPFADQPDNNRLRLPLGGGLGGGILGGGGGGGGGGVAGGAAAGGGNANGNGNRDGGGVNGNGHGQGGLGFGNNIAMQIIQTVGGVLGGQLGALGGGGGNGGNGGGGGIQHGHVQVQVNYGPIQGGALPAPLNGGVPGPGARTRRAAGPPPAPGGAAGGGGAANGLPLPPIVGNAAGGNFIGGAFNIPGIHLFGFNQVNQLPPTPFFEELIQSCPNLLSLELYGRRYTSTLLPLLQERDELEFLALSVPLDNDRVGSGFEEGLKSCLKDGLKSLTRMELSGRGGEWLATERRGIKEICEGRGIVYASST